jgi:hypothetical protein
VQVNCHFVIIIWSFCNLVILYYKVHLKFLKIFIVFKFQKWWVYHQYHLTSMKVHHLFQMLIQFICFNLLSCCLSDCCHRCFIILNVWIPFWILSSPIPSMWNVNFNVKILKNNMISCISKLVDKLKWIEKWNIWKKWSLIWISKYKS